MGGQKHDPMATWMEMTTSDHKGGNAPDELSDTNSTQKGAVSVICAIETATPICSVALWVDGRLFERTETGQGIHSSRLPLQVQEILEEAAIGIREVQQWVVSAGPGSFTGLRIGASLLKGLLYAHKRPLIAVDTLGSLVWDALASGGHPDRVHAVLDARREHLYHCSASRPCSIRTLSEISTWITSSDHLIGTGWERLREPLAALGMDLDRLTLTGLDAVRASRLIRMVRGLEASRSANTQAWLRQVEIDDFSPTYLVEGMATG